jgi:cytoskeletal protein CcmA (bactofilin family)
MNDTRTRGDIRISGAGTVATGVYNNVTISGAGTLTGDIECVRLKVSRSADGQGSLKADSMSVSGSFHFRGDVAGGDTKV